MNPNEAVTCRLEPADHFARGGVFVRMLIVALFLVPATLNWVVLLVILPPGVAAYRAAGRGRELERGDGDRLRAVLQWTAALYAHVGFLTDRLVLDASDEVVRFEFPEPLRSRRPRAAARAATALPSALAFTVLALSSFGVWLIAAVSILFTTTYPGSLQRFQIRVLCYETWLLAYQAMLVDTYPRFAAPAGRPPRKGQGLGRR